MAILRLLGRKYGYYPESADTLDLLWEIDSNLDANIDIQNKYWYLHFAKDEEFKKLMQDYQNKDLPQYLKMLENRLQSNVTQKYIAGDKMTLADLDNAHVAWDYFLNKNNKFYDVQSKILEQYNVVNKYYEGLREELKDHFDHRPQDKPY